MILWQYSRFRERRDDMTREMRLWRERLAAARASSSVSWSNSSCVDIQGRAVIRHYYVFLFIRILHIKKNERGRMTEGPRLSRPARSSPRRRVLRRRPPLGRSGCPCRPEAREVLGRPKLCTLAHAFLWKDSKIRLQLAQLLGQLGVCLTFSQKG